MFTNSILAMSSSSARAHRRLVETSSPMTALTTNTADSHTRSAPSASATKLGSPGVSSRVILRSCHSSELSVAEIDIWRACSSGSESETVVPSGTDPRRLVTPASNRSASCSAVFPDPRCPTRATLRIRSAGGCMSFSFRWVRSPYRWSEASASGLSAYAPQMATWQLDPRYEQPSACLRELVDLVLGDLQGSDPIPLQVGWEPAYAWPGPVAQGEEEIPPYPMLMISEPSRWGGVGWTPAAPGAGGDREWGDRFTPAELAVGLADC